MPASPSESPQEVGPVVGRTTREIRLGGLPRQVECETERWPYGVTVARIGGTAVYGEGPDLDAAVADLAENVVLFIDRTRKALARGATLGGAVRKDWETLQRLAGGEPTTA